MSDNNTPIVSTTGLRFDLTKQLVESVHDLSGFMTGSAVIGGFNNDSDIDVVFPIYTSTAVDVRLRRKSLELGFNVVSSDYNGGYKLARSGNVILNVIRLHPYDYCAWLFATNTLKKQLVIHDKFTRHRAFELAVTLFKLVNSGADYVSRSGAEIFYSKNHEKPLIDEFNDFVKSEVNSLTVLEIDDAGNKKKRKWT